MLTANMIILRAMVEAFVRVRPLHLVNIGSDAVFADEPLPLTEAAPKAPSSLHGVMHAAREIAFAEVKAPLATLRPTLIYGVADPHNGYGPNRFRRHAEAGKEIVLFGEGEERRDHVLVDDVAELALRILLQRSQGSLNAVTGQVWSFRDIAERVARLYAPVVPVRGTPREGAMPHGGYRPFDPRATRMAFPDFEYTSLPEGLAQMHHQTHGRH
jgi:nucleoside-diphosphate-sugar epimerase